MFCNEYKFKDHSISDFKLFQGFVPQAEQILHDPLITKRLRHHRNINKLSYFSTLGDLLKETTLYNVTIFVVNKNKMPMSAFTQWIRETGRKT